MFSAHFTASLFVGHAQCWLYCVCSVPLYTRMHSLKHPHLHKYVSCCILATGKVITERAKELACCRAADLIPAIEKKEGRDVFFFFFFGCVAQQSTSNLAKCIFCLCYKSTVLLLTSMSDILNFIPQNLPLCRSKKVTKYE